ncbi:MAG: hypothetical protein ACFFD4_18465 [Candidatus Odinarchaeota archaeon]
MKRKEKLYWFILVAGMTVIPFSMFNADANPLLALFLLLLGVLVCLVSILWLIKAYQYEEAELKSPDQTTALRTAMAVNISVRKK